MRMRADVFFRSTVQQKKTAPASVSTRRTNALLVTYGSILSHSSALVTPSAAPQSTCGSVCSPHRIRSQDNAHAHIHRETLTTFPAPEPKPVAKKNKDAAWLDGIPSSLLESFGLGVFSARLSIFAMPAFTKAPKHTQQLTASARLSAIVPATLALTTYFCNSFIKQRCRPKNDSKFFRAFRY